ncbi:DUF4331 family protein [Cognatilysobacter bugurensis]|uniref:DUF4331 domain-containing protein n=1 Tax=Cognatilysobacter bugurensis TaxID=543356 RepID=A0A918W7F8_9GAMM|nr:DUF4331 family protein [Lysobacter bugurensis]GHA72628.1 hypothetical protein GCM10007067_06440 [Lysobacter bugurensis]
MKRTLLAVALTGLVIGGAAIGSSHREAPQITEMPKVDNTDFYMFRSYEPGREGYVTLIANYQPFQDPFGGPNYFTMDEDALYAIHVDANGDAYSDTSFYFRFENRIKGLTVPVGGQDVAVPLINIGPFGGDPEPEPVQNRIESYAFASVHKGKVKLAQNLDTNKPFFYKPIDNIGNKSIPDYESYANSHIYRVGLDNCAGESRVFVGQRREGFVVNVGEIFDLVNLNPVGERDLGKNALENKNVTTIALEVPISCLTTASSPIIGAWATAALPNKHGRFTQVSRLSAPLVNEVVIGLPDKDKFNRTSPRGDAAFAKYVQYPTLPVLLQTLFPEVQAPSQYPRQDLVQAFLTGVPGLNQPANVRPAEMMRLNTSIAPVPAAQQDSLAVLAGDVAGFPNGRRPGDDVVDIELRVAMGALLPQDVAPSGQLPYTDGALVTAARFKTSFPYLNTPLPGSPFGVAPPDDGGAP